jgi:hypothetical protein
MKKLSFDEKFFCFFAAVWIFYATLFYSCALVDINPVAQDLIAYNLGIEYAQACPDRVDEAILICDFLMNTDDPILMHQVASAAVIELSGAIKDKRTRQNIKRLAGQIQIDISPAQMDCIAVAAAAESFKEGLTE